MGQSYLYAPIMHGELVQIDCQRQIYQHCCTGRYYSKHVEHIGSDAQLQHFKEIFLLRKVHEQYLVSGYCSEVSTVQAYCAEQNRVSYYLQVINTRLSELYEMPTRNGIMLLLHAIKGFKVLYENVGYFTVDPRMVVFNCKGECKVWMHEQLNVIGVLSDVVTINSDEPNIRSQFIRQIVHSFDILRDQDLPGLSYSQLLAEYPLLTFEVVEQTLLNCLKDEGSIINKTRRRKTITYNSPKGCMKQTQMEMVGMSGQFGHRQSHSGHGQSHLGKIMVNVDHTEQKQNCPTMSVPRVLQTSKGKNSLKTSVSKTSVRDTIKRVEKTSYTDNPPKQFIKKGGHRFMNEILEEQDDKHQLPILNRQPQLPKYHDHKNYNSQDFTQKSMKFDNQLNKNDIIAPSRIEVHKRRHTMQIGNIVGGYKHCPNPSQNNNINESTLLDDDDSFFKSNQFQRLANVNTIKSIHTLDYDQKLDTEILIDLAEIITKYRGRLVDMPKRQR